MKRLTKYTILPLFILLYSAIPNSSWGQTDLYDAYYRMKYYGNSTVKQDYIFYVKDSLIIPEEKDIPIDTFYNKPEYVTKDGEGRLIDITNFPRGGSFAFIYSIEHPYERGDPEEFLYSQPGVFFDHIPVIFKRTDYIHNSEGDIVKISDYMVRETISVLKTKGSYLPIKVDPDTIKGFYFCSRCGTYKTSFHPQQLKTEDIEYYTNIEKVQFLFEDDVGRFLRFPDPDYHYYSIINWINSTESIKSVRLGMIYPRNHLLVANNLQHIKKPVISLGLFINDMFDQNMLDSILGLFPLENIKELSLAIAFKRSDYLENYERISFELPHVSRMKSLEKLYLMGDVILPKEFKKLKNLKTFAFYPGYFLKDDKYQSYPNIDFPEIIGELKNLEALKINLHRMNEIPEFKNKMENLKLLVLSYMDSINTLPESFKQFKSLEYLFLSGLDNSVSLKPFEGLPIRLIEAKDYNLSNKVLNRLSNFKHLEYFNMRYPDNFMIEPSDFKFLKALTNDMQIYINDAFIGFAEEYYIKKDKEPFLNWDYFEVIR